MPTVTFKLSSAFNQAQVNGILVDLKKIQGVQDAAEKFPGETDPEIKNICYIRADEAGIASVIRHLGTLSGVEYVHADPPRRGIPRLRR